MCVPPDFNEAMLAIWEELWCAMPETSNTSPMVHELLKLYKERCKEELDRPRTSSEPPPALLPVSFAQAKNWILKQQRSRSQAIESGAVNEEARSVVTELSFSLSEQASAAMELLEQPVQQATPVFISPALSLGPEPVTAEERAQERREEQARKRTELTPRTGGKEKAKAPKWKRALSPESQQRREKALARLQELGVQPLPVSLKFY